MAADNPHDAILSKILRWATFPMRAEVEFWEWSAFLILILAASFMWTTVVGEIQD